MPCPGFMCDVCVFACVPGLTNKTTCWLPAYNCPMTTPSLTPHTMTVRREVSAVTYDQLTIDIVGIILCMRPSNERWRYSVTPSLIGWAHTQNDPWYSLDVLTYWGQDACQSTGSSSGQIMAVWCRAITWTNAEIIESLGLNERMHFKCLWEDLGPDSI